MLQHPTTILLASVFLLTALCIVILLYRAGIDNRFRATDHYMYFTAQYVLSIIGTLTVIAFRSMVQEFHRMTPYLSTADRTDQRQSGAPALWSVAFRYFPDMFYFEIIRPNLTTFADILTPIVLFLIAPTKASLLSPSSKVTGPGQCYCIVYQPCT